MSWLRRNPVFAGLVVVLALCVLGEAGFVAERRAAAPAGRKRLEQVRRELRTLEATQPAPTRENTALIEADLAQGARMLAALQAGLRPAGDQAARLFSTPAPSRRPEAFFDIAEFVEAMRSRARQAGVLLRPDERFGFSRYAHEAPETDQLAAVFHDRLVVQYLLEALLEAQPHQLLSVQRSRPGGKAGAGATGTAAGSAGRGAPGAASADYFEMDPRISSRTQGVVEATAFRLCFSGHTKTLRALLIKLAESDLPLVVRAVEVMPDDRRSDARGPGQTAAPLVASAWSRFAVTVEFIASTSQPATAS